LVYLKSAFFAFQVNYCERERDKGETEQIKREEIKGERQTDKE
jgi:hypothetical protein